MNPSFADKRYQRELAQRGAFLEYDMIGMSITTPTSRRSRPPTRRTPARFAN